MSVKKLTINASGASAGYLPPYTTAAVTYYVATTGSDSNPGTSALPFLTIQKAVDLIPKLILHPVVINIGAGNFAGFNACDFNVGIPVDLTAGAYLQFLGTMSAVTPATGTGTGTATAGASGSTNVQGTLTDAGQAWTVNNLRGKFIHTIAGTGSGQYMPIVSNTATAITVPTAWTAPGAGTTYEIITPGTVINTAVNIPASASAATSGAVTSGVRLINNSAISWNTGDFMQMQYMMFTAGTTAVAAWDAGAFAFRNCTLNGTGTLTSLNGSSSGARFTQCAFLASAAQISISVGATAGVTTMRAQSCLFLSGGNGISCQNGYMLVQNNTFLSHTNSAIAFIGGQGMCSFSGNFIDNTASGILGSESGAGSGTPGIIIFASSGKYDNCSVAVNLAGAFMTATLGTIAGSGSTTVISVQKGASCRLAAAATITGTTEISVDSVSTTFATMRAATPKVVSNSNYGSKVYE